MPTAIPSALFAAVIELPSKDAAADKSYSELIAMVAICTVGLAFAIGLNWLSPVPDACSPLFQSSAENLSHLQTLAKPPES